MTGLLYKVECRFTHYFEAIAAFDCQPAAVAYALQCSEAAFKGVAYRVKKGRRVLRDFPAKTE